MSYVGLNPAQLGILIPQEPVTGRLLKEQMIIFDLLQSVSVQESGQVARHPVQSGREGPSDAILEEPARVVVSASFVDKPLNTGLIPLPMPYSQPDRCLAQGVALLNFKRRRQLMTAVFPGFVLADRAISQLEVSPSPEATEVNVNFTLEHVRVVGLNLIAAIADSDSKALGSQVVEQGL